MISLKRVRASVGEALVLARKSSHTLRHHGWREFYNKAARKLRPPLVQQPAWSKTYAAEALILAQWLDFTPEELARSQTLVAEHRGKLAIETINWYVPHFEHAYYGGMYTILRFASFFAQHYGVHSSFVILGDVNSPQPEDYRARIAAAYAPLAGAGVVVVRSDADLPAVQPADACIATLWSTAYYVLKFNQTKRKFYFLQDFEPMFYPAGSTSAQVEASYRFGFYALTNTVPLRDHYRRDYGGEATYFTPSVDTSVFYPPVERRADGGPFRVFFYARPGHYRNGFELGAVALRKLKERLGNRVQIISAGQKWEPSEYGLEGVVENLGLLTYGQTAELYRTCDAGLAMMFTRHPSYLPFEFMASGCLVVSNNNHETSWLLKDGENCLLSIPSASSIAATIARGLEDTALRQRITERALRLIHEQFSDWNGQIERVYAYMCDPRHE